MKSSASKTAHIVFWVSTVLIAAMTLPSAFIANSQMTIDGFQHLGVGADWFRWELEIGKTIGAIILVLPMIQGRVKEWVYAAFGIDFISAMIAMTAVDGIATGAPVLIAIALLATSYLSYQKIARQKISLI